MAPMPLTRLPLACALLSSLACAGPRIPFPTFPIAESPLPEAPPSEIAFLVQLPLVDLKSEVERHVPAKLDEKGIRIRRQDVTIGGSGNRIGVSIPISASKRIEEKIDNPFRALFGSDKWRVIDITLKATARIDMDIVLEWVEGELVPRVEIRNVEAEGDLASRVRSLAKKRAERKASDIAAAVRAHYASAGRLQSLWSDLSRRRLIDKRLALDLRSEGILVSEPRVREGRVGFDAIVRARPTLASRDSEEPPKTELPPVRTWSDGAPGGFRVSVDLELGFDECTQQLRDAVVGREFAKQDQRVAVVDVRMHGTSGSAATVLAVELEGDFDGTIYFVGNLQYDERVYVFSIPNLDFSAETGDVLKKLALWWFHEELRELLLSNTRWSVADRIEPIRDGVQAALSNANVEVPYAFALDRMKPVGITCGPTGFTGRVLLEGRVIATSQP